MKFVFFLIQKRQHIKTCALKSKFIYQKKQAYKPLIWPSFAAVRKRNKSIAEFAVIWDHIMLFAFFPFSFWLTNIRGQKMAVTRSCVFLFAYMLSWKSIPHFICVNVFQVSLKNLESVWLYVTSYKYDTKSRSIFYFCTLRKPNKKMSVGFDSQT